MQLKSNAVPLLIFFSVVSYVVVSGKAGSTLELFHAYETLWRAYNRPFEDDTWIRKVS